MILTILSFIVYSALCMFSMWLMDVDNPNSYYYVNGEISGYILLSIFSIIPILNIIAGSVNTTRFNN